MLAAFEDMRAEAATWIEGAAARTGEVAFEHGCRHALRRAGVRDRRGGSRNRSTTASRTRASPRLSTHAHERLYGFRDPESVVEAVSVRLRIVGRVDRPELTGPPEIRAARGPRSRRRVFVDDRWVEVPVFHREDLGPSQRLQGPVLVEQEDTTVFFPQGWSGEVDARGNLLFRVAPRGAPPGGAATDRAVAAP